MERDGGGGHGEGLASRREGGGEGKRVERGERVRAVRGWRRGDGKRAKEEEKMGRKEDDATLEITFIIKTLLVVSHN